MLRIPVCYSFDAPLLAEFQGDEYVPVGCGGYSSAFTEKTDSTGDNISEYNPYLNELTMIYWVAKNYAELGNPDYIGFAHYRRFLKFDRRDLAENTIFCAFEDQPGSLYQTYCMYHVRSDIDAFFSSFCKKFPQLAQELIAYFSQRRHAKCNMMVTSRRLFFEYFSFIEPCIGICIDELFPKIKLDSRDRYQRRALGFILERMTGFWIWLKQREKTVDIAEAKIEEALVSSIYSRPSHA